MTHGSLFSGIGGFDLAADWMGWENVFNCEWEEFPRQVLKYHFPNAEQFGDIREFDASNYLGRIDIITGGFPCQPYSNAGKRKGKEDERHLWPEMLRIIREVRPRWIVGENVRGLCTWSGGLVLEECCADLENEGYAVQPFIIPACAKGAPHRRDRVWIVAHADGSSSRNNLRADESEASQVRRGKAGYVPDQLCGLGDVAHAQRVRLEHGAESRNVRGVQGEESEGGRKPTNASKANGEKRPTSDTHNRQRVRSEQELRSGGHPANGCGEKPLTNAVRSRGGQNNGQGKPRQPNKASAFDEWRSFPTFSPLCGRDDGVSLGLANVTFSKWRRESIKAYGNAIVPQVAYELFKAIQAYEDEV